MTIHAALTPVPRTAIRACGMVSSLGESVVASCAAARAGIVRARPILEFEVADPDSGEVAPVIGHFVEGRTEGFVGWARLARLANLALEDLRRRTPPMTERKRKLAVLVNVPSGYYRRHAAAAEWRAVAAESIEEFERELDEQMRVEREAMRVALAKYLGLAARSFGDITRVEITLEDGAGMVSVLRNAAEMLASREADACLVGAVDSLIPKEELEALLQLRLLKTQAQPQGLMPGEAAAFALLERGDSAGAPSAFVDAPVALPIEPQVAAQLAPDGRALADCLRASLERSPEGPEAPLDLIGSLNGTTWRARDWGAATCVAPRSVCDARDWHPALAFGDIGAASSAVALCAAVRAFERGYARARRTLVWSSDGTGAVSAFQVAAPPAVR